MADLQARHDIGMFGEIKLYAGTASPGLASEIARYLNLPLEGREIIEYANENLFVQLHHSVRGQDVYVIQHTAAPVNRNLMELLILLQTLRLDSAGRITAVIPYMCYSRSDKKDRPRVPISARLVCDMIQTAGADRYITLDLHAGQIQGFFNIPGDVLTTFHLIKDYLNGQLGQMHKPVVVTADLGFAKKGRNLAAGLGVPVAFVEKVRSGVDGSAEALTVIGQVANRDAILVDDEIDTAGSMAEAVRLVKREGARDVYVVCIHPVFSPPAVERLKDLPVKKIITTDTVPISPAKQAPLQDKLHVLSVAPLLGEVILRAHEGRSVGEMFRE